ncbi:hypothetical protein PHLCEN_2v7329 [Hermanssonia centrifuga]|uniref:Uncharacterized protein n=1 Tax=Hermanssonia centrifuga TaxID=98765 RepID=A0A2R6NWT9_9APHY|nr:hypothetical protein PHLCEN_2v7329 [Hermanssonia centrifuga]
MLRPLGYRILHGSQVAIITPWRCISTGPTGTVASTPSWKEPGRGGQNLSQRYERLEKSLRGKGTYQQAISQLSHEAASPLTPSARRTKDKREIFMGLVVPEEPKPPGPDGTIILVSYTLKKVGLILDH